MSYQEDTIEWMTVSEIDTWLDTYVPSQYNGTLAQDWARISKIQEELGEAIAAFIGLTGQNPRKGITHDSYDVLQELADTALTAIFAMQHFTKNTSVTRDLLRKKQDAVYKRMKESREKAEN